MAAVRFDREIAIGIPNAAARQRILQVIREREKRAERAKEREREERAEREGRES